MTDKTPASTEPRPYRHLRDTPDDNWSHAIKGTISRIDTKANTLELIASGGRKDTTLGEQATDLRHISDELRIQIGELFIELKRLQGAAGACGPVVAQQAPEWTPSPPGDTISDIMNEKGISRLRLGCMLDLRECSVSSLLNGEFLIDNDMATRLSECLGSSVEFWENREYNYRRELREIKSGEHDATLIAQEREKWERERTQLIDEQRHRVGKMLIQGICDPNGDCAQCILCDNAGGCLADGSKQVQIAAAQAREDVLDDVMQYVKKHEWISSEFNSNMRVFTVKPFEQFVDSLRSEVKK